MSKRHIFLNVLAMTGLWLWLYPFQSGNTIVAVIDSGISYEEPLSAENTLVGIDLLEGDFSPQDENGHGTNVAGIIHKQAPSAFILPIKVLDRDGILHMNTSFAILYATLYGANIINMSYSESYNPFTQAAIWFGQLKGVIFVGSSGNDGEYKLNYPSRYRGVLSVGSTDDAFQKLSTFSNQHEQLDYVAPGENIVAAHYERSGTSMSAAYVSGCLASLLLYHHKKLSTQELLHEFDQLTHRSLRIPYGRIVDGNKITAFQTQNMYSWVSQLPAFVQDPTVSFSVSTVNADQIEVYQNQQQVLSTTNTKLDVLTLTLDEGENHIMITARKKNQRYTTRATITYDHTPPKLVAQIIPISGRQYLKLIADDPTFESLKLSFGTQRIQTSVGESHRFESWFPLSPHSYPVTVSLKDRAGNTSTYQSLSVEKPFQRVQESSETYLYGR